MPIKKESENSGLTGSDKKFNNFLSKARVRVEHCFTALKGRFASLEELRSTLTWRKDLARHTDWVRTCTVIHNFCLKHDHPAFLGEIIDNFQNAHDIDDEFYESVRECYAARNDHHTEEGEIGDYLADVSFDDSVAAKNKWNALKKSYLEMKGYNIQELDAKDKQRHQ